MKNNLILFILVLIIVAGGSFFGGLKYQESKSPARGQFRQRTGVNGQNGQAVRGQIIDASADSLTIKLTDGSSIIILLSTNTTIGKMTAGVKSDLKTGETISAFGTKNADGSVTAGNIQLGSPKP